MLVMGPLIISQSVPVPVADGKTKQLVRSKSLHWSIRTFPGRILRTTPSLALTDTIPAQVYLHLYLIACGECRAVKVQVP